MSVTLFKFDDLMYIPLILTFRKEYRILLKSLCQKLQERSPLKSLLIRCAAALSPWNMATDSEVSIHQFEKLADYLHERKHITSQQCADSKVQYEEFLDSIVKVNKESFSKFQTAICRVDQFLGVYLNSSKEFESLWLICKFVFTLSYGQSQIERGFNVNKDSLCVNIERKSLKARRMVYDHMAASKVSVASFVIKKELVQSCKASHSRYIVHMEEIKKKEAAQAGTNKRKLLQEELAIVKRRRLELEAVVTSLQKDIESYSIQASEKEDLVEMKALITKANSFREAVKTKAETIKDLEDASQKLEKEIKEL